MATIFPDCWDSLEAKGAFPFETANLGRLAAELPPDYSIFHGIHWMNASRVASTSAQPGHDAAGDGDERERSAGVHGPVWVMASQGQPSDAIKAWLRVRMSPHATGQAVFKWG